MHQFRNLVVICQATNSPGAGQKLLNRSDFGKLIYRAAPRDFLTMAPGDGFVIVLVVMPCTSTYLQTLGNHRGQPQQRPPSNGASCHGYGGGAGSPSYTPYFVRAKPHKKQPTSSRSMPAATTPAIPTASALVVPPVMTEMEERRRGILISISEDGDDDDVVGSGGGGSSRDRDEKTKKRWIGPRRGRVWGARGCRWSTAISL